MHFQEILFVAPDTQLLLYKIGGEGGTFNVLIHLKSCREFWDFNLRGDMSDGLFISIYSM